MSFLFLNSEHDGRLSVLQFQGLKGFEPQLCSRYSVCVGGSICMSQCIISIMCDSHGYERMTELTSCGL